MSSDRISDSTGPEAETGNGQTTGFAINLGYGTNTGDGTSTPPVHGTNTGEGTSSSSGTSAPPGYGTNIGYGASRSPVQGNEWEDISFNSRDPVYLQVVRLFKEKIVTGALQPGQAIPSRRELAALLKINPNTAQRAYKEMEDQRLIVTEGNSPSRITQELAVLSGIRSELLGGAVEAFISSIRNIDVPLDELLDLVRRKYREIQATGKEEGGTRDD